MYRVGLYVGEAVYGESYGKEPLTRQKRRHYLRNKDMVVSRVGNRVKHGHAHARVEKGMIIRGWNYGRG